MRYVKIERRVAAHYILAAIVFMFYGAQVCPLLEEISPVTLVFPILVSLLIRLLSISIMDRQAIEKQVSFQFFLDLCLFLLAGLALNIHNSLLYDAPLESILKVMVGVFILGAIVALDLSLAREKDIAQYLIKSGKTLELSENFLSFGKKFSVAAVGLVTSISLVFFLVINKDLSWLVDNTRYLDINDARVSIIKEISFVAVVLLAYSIRIVYSYVTNLNMYLYYQNHTLLEVMNGDLDKRVPVVSPDEFGRMAEGTNAMIASLAQHQDELRLTRDVSVLALASLAETRDNETGGHILRTQHYVKVLAESLSSHADFKDRLDAETIDLLYKSAPLHDIGKVGIPDSILLKPGKLTDEEFIIMKTHAQLGADSLAVAEERLGSNSFLQFSREIAACHHEKWDGSGYPKGLRGDEIPLSARLMALADVYDALISKRVYKPAFDHGKAKSIILEGDGTHFDPRVVAAFLSCENDFIDIAAEYKDEL